MSKETDEEKALREARLAEIRENFENNGLAPELVKAISEFGDLWGIRTWFYLDKEKPKGYLSLNYRYQDGFFIYYS